MKKVIVLMVGMCILFFVTGCNTREEKVVTTQEQYQKIFDENNYVIIDVRNKHEYDTNHVKGAINIPYKEIDDDIDIAKDKILFVYCYSGTRSKIAYDALVKLGYTVYDLGAFDRITLDKTNA